MKILIIPDVHGREFWKEPAEHIAEFDKVIFLGDYHDPYPGEVSKDTSRHRLRDELVPWIEANKDKVVCLVGNHDIPYLVGGECCRHDDYHEKEIAGYLRRMPLQLIYQIDGYLFSHSGVLPEWLLLNKLNIEDLNSINLGHPALQQISMYRGGLDVVGSCVWGDAREYHGASHIPDIYQIFGHTQLYDAYIVDTFACVDCRKAFVLNTETKVLVSFDSYNNNDS